MLLPHTPLSEPDASAPGLRILSIDVPMYVEDSYVRTRLTMPAATTIVELEAPLGSRPMRIVVLTDPDSTLRIAVEIIATVDSTRPSPGKTFLGSMQLEDKLYVWASEAEVLS